MKDILVVENLSKKFTLLKAKSSIIEIFKPKQKKQEFYALKDVSFSLPKGEILGIVGLNGSGKSTLVNLISEIGEPTSGTFRVDGTTAILAIRSGMQSNLTGYENIQYKLLLLGFAKADIEKLVPKIIEFSELGDFIYQPIKTYSSGMKSKLGFSIAIHVDPDLLIIDESLSVGDKDFAEKSYNIMRDRIRNGKTIIFISHSLPQVRELCTKALWLNKGQVMDYGDNVTEIVQRYYDYKVEKK